MLDSDKPNNGTFPGFEKVSFNFQGRNAWYVLPSSPAPGNPWIWNAHFDIEQPEVIADQIYNYSVPVRLNLKGDQFHTNRNTLINSFTKFTNEKTGRVVFLGGSITQNPGWRDKICRYMEERFPETEFDFVNAGISSTGSIPGAFRFETDVMANGEVDLLFEEAAVNDRTNGTNSDGRIRGMEGIVRHALSVNPKMDIVLLYFVDPEKMQDYRNNITPAEIIDFEKVARHYNVSSINLAKEITERIDHGEFSWEDDFKNLHPSPFGQEIYFQSIRSFLENSWQLADSSIKTIDNPIPSKLDQLSYSNGSYVDIRKSERLKGFKLEESWQPADNAATRKHYVDVPFLTGEQPGNEFIFSFHGTAIGICVTAGPDAGIIEYSIDGKPFVKQDLFTTWSHKLHIPWYYILNDELPCKSHVLKIRIASEHNPMSSGNACRIAHFLVNGCDQIL